MADDSGLKHYTGEKAQFISSYTPSLLASIPRTMQRSALGITAENLPFEGMDIWNAFEFTWLNGKGRPEVASLQILVPAMTSDIIESKSLKLYLGSYSNTRFTHRSEVITSLESDLSLAAKTAVSVNLISPEVVQQEGLSVAVGHSLDLLDIEVDEYYWNPEPLIHDSETIVKESLYSHLFRSICPITGQPDFATILVQYTGASISKEGLLRYLISYREHAEFGEQILERIFVDINNRCQPERLKVQARFTRRGGIDINPIRSNYPDVAMDLRMWRQ